jgi:periplasmic protein CpxP/Spy
MPLTPDHRESVAAELRRSGTDLNLTEEQKQKLHNFMSDAYEKLQEYKQENPNASREDLLRKVEDNRASIRQRIVTFVTPDQLTKWDAEIGKAKEFLGQKLAA